MKHLTIIVRPERVSSVTAALQAIGVTGMTISDVRGQGTQKGTRTLYRGVEYQTDFIVKNKIETIISDGLYDQAVEAIIEAARTGSIGDGKIFVSEISEVIRIRTGETGEHALGS
ncbi:P-II family nitrogen regulator [Paenibacillus protaetiae]|uniref:P-II family nitrogen regulator n=1 Tax=Paenibacillus protaetiae TaxID=2509456 RepID=A0A4V0YF86_9BACL|nr:P-II family nitrogen regulator [Paenibacillus protaetiae]QAY66841.1 P-II family nitrogen regulator [Paenibacillus protaetiae]